MKENTCCFTGHRKLPQDKMEQIVNRLNDEIENLYHQGVTNFISGGALGFDQLAASLIIARKELGYDIRLIFALPYRNQDKYWTPEQERLYHNLLSKADETIYVSEQYNDSCMKKRNYYMVDRSSYCICALLYGRSGTSQTARYAQQKNIPVINVAD